MTDTDLTHIYFLLDRSGSMQSIRAATIEGGSTPSSPSSATPPAGAG